MWSVLAGGVHIVFGDPTLRTQFLLGWLAGSTSFPGLAAPHAHSLGGTEVSVGLP